MSDASRFATRLGPGSAFPARGTRARRSEKRESESHRNQKDEIHRDREFVGTRCSRACASPPRPPTRSPQSSARRHASRFTDETRPPRLHVPVPRAPRRAVPIVQSRILRHRKRIARTHPTKNPDALGAVVRVLVPHEPRRVSRVRATVHFARRVLRQRHDRAPQRRRRGSARRAVLRGPRRVFQVRVSHDSCSKPKIVPQTGSASPKRVARNCPPETALADADDGLSFRTANVFHREPRTANCEPFLSGKRLC